jgi:glycosyltransferase involved in cell wall biosynthesis
MAALSLRILLTADPMIPVPPRLYGGIERIVDGLLRALCAEGHEVALLAHADSTASAATRFSWAVAEPRSALHHVRNALALDLAMRRFRPQVLHSFSRLAYLGRWLRTRVPKVMSYQRLPTRRVVRAAGLLAGSSLQFTGCSEFIARLGANAGGCWHAIPNFVDLTRFDYRSQVADDAPLVFLSRIERVKGAHTAIEIARRAGRRLVIAGNRVESPIGAEYFRTEIAPQIDDDRIRYVGAVDDAQKNSLLGSAAAMLLPLEWDEPFGIVMAEALACGTPVIVFRRGAAAEIVRDRVDGFVVDDAKSATAAVLALTQIRRSDCRQRVESCFTSSVVARRYIDLYRGMACN